MSYCSSPFCINKLPKSQHIVKGTIVLVQQPWADIKFDLITGEGFGPYFGYYLLDGNNNRMYLPAPESTNPSNVLLYAIYLGVCIIYANVFTRLSASDIKI